MKEQKGSRWTAFRKELETLAKEQGMEIRRAFNLPGEGGSCKLRGKPLVLMNSHIPEIKKARILADALKKSEIDSVYIRPELREFIETGVMPRRRFAKTKN